VGQLHEMLEKSQHLGVSAIVARERSKSRNKHRETFAGDIDGESTVRALQTLGDEQSASLVSVQRFRFKVRKSSLLHVPYSSLNNRLYFLLALRFRTEQRSQSLRSSHPELLVATVTGTRVLHDRYSRYGPSSYSSADRMAARMLIGLALNWLMPLSFMPAALPAGWIGGAVFAVALALFAWAIATITGAGSNVPTSKPATTIVDTGPYRFTRNPIYLGMFLGLVGLAMAFDSLWLLAVLVPFALIIRYGVVAREEAYLERKFDDVFRRYRSRVRRWLSDSRKFQPGSHAGIGLAPLQNSGRIALVNLLSTHVRNYGDVFRGAGAHSWHQGHYSCDASLSDYVTDSTLKIRHRISE
jgi:protein-S-isoprenylcysteine O-methyltransferase Ste14